MEDVRECIRKWALKNAYDYGKAVPGKIVGKVIGECPDAKKDMKKIMSLIDEETRRVNSLSKEELGKELSCFAFEKKEEKEKKIELPNAVQGKVVTRFPPEPSGFLHIGHAKAAFLNYEGARNYNGKMRLRFDDTNPEKEKSEFVDAIIEGLRWLGIEWGGEITYTSDYMEKLYGFAEKMILGNKAYVCKCKAEKISKCRMEGKGCTCRAKMPQDSLAEFKAMVNGEYGGGSAILRFMGDMEAENTVMRDPTLFRIIKERHFRQGDKYSCWPSYDFAAPIIDSIEGITHAMRSKEYELREGLYFSILEILGLRKPKLIHFSRLSIANSPVSKRLIAPLIEQGKVSGYDDPRLPTLVALKRRGIRPEAIREFVLQFGLSKVESEPSFDKLINLNRKMIDAHAPRRFFVPSPAKASVAGFEEKEVELKNHPTNEKMGKRKVKVEGNLWIPGDDAQKLGVGEVFRLKDLCNVKVVGKGEGEIKLEYVGKIGKVEKKVQWVCDSSKVEAEVMVVGDLLKNGEYNPESMKIVSGYVEGESKKLSVDDIVQFERFGFARLDRKDGKMKFVMVGK